MSCSPTGTEEIFNGSVLLQDFPSAASVTFPNDKKDTVSMFDMRQRLEKKYMT